MHIHALTEIFMEICKKELKERSGTRAITPSSWYDDGSENMWDFPATPCNTPELEERDFDVTMRELIQQALYNSDNSDFDTHIRHVEWDQEHRASTGTSSLAAQSSSELGLE
jgi:hypothetical protein